MKIKSQKFIKGIVQHDSLLESNIPQIAFIGRSNSGKSTLINTITNSKIARTSSFPGRTQQINIFLINESFYLVDLPGYGYAKTSKEKRQKIYDLIDMYLFDSLYKQKRVVFIIDANVGFTDSDLAIFRELENYQKDLIIVANKIDKMNQSQVHKKLKEIKIIAGDYTLIPFSSKKKIGIDVLTKELFN